MRDVQEILNEGLKGLRPEFGPAEKGHERARQDVVLFPVNWKQESAKTLLVISKNFRDKNENNTLIYYDRKEVYNYFQKKTTVTNQDSAKSTTINLIKDFKDLNEDD